MRVKNSVILLAVAALSVFASGCGGTAVSEPWNGFPVGNPIAYADRNTKSDVIAKIVEESVGSAFVDHDQDTFEDDVVSVCNSSYEIPSKYIDALWSTMEEYSFETSFYVIDLQTGMSFGLNVDKEFSAASTIKLGYAYWLARQLDEGNFAWDDILEYKEENYCTGSGSTQYSEYGTLFTLKALFYRMLYNSDNVAYYMLTEHTGYSGYNEYLASIGSSASISWLNHWSYLTPRDLAKIWLDIWDYKDETENGAILWEYLTTNLYNEVLVAIPEYENTGCAHKSGWNTQGYHESAIVRGKRDYICVVMTETGNKNDCLHRTIVNIDNIMNDYDTWLKNREG